ncbi:MAG: hypothetical protein EPN38_02800 [Rhodanobacteraceae bacterium]|nr:MAG: hypothetical protein EPN38_02800 [Rhodanobacteraceae bacterium]
MNAATARERQLRALGVAPLQLRPRPVAPAIAAASAPAAPAATGPAVIRRLALQPDRAELTDPAVNKMYTALTAAVGKAGLQIVRVCDVAHDPTAAVMLFGAAPLPEGVPPLRVLRADPLRVLCSDRERKRLLWERMQALGRGEAG